MSSTTIAMCRSLAIRTPPSNRSPEYSCGRSWNGLAVFSSYLERGPQVEAVEMFLIGAICHASREYLRRTNAPEALPGREEPGAVTPGDALLGDIDRKMLLGQILAACLDQPHLEMLHRYYRKDEGVEAIAAVMVVTRETVETMLFESRKQVFEVYKAVLDRSWL